MPSGPLTQVTEGAASPAAARVRVQVVAADDAAPARWLLVDLAKCRTVQDVATRIGSLHPDLGAHGTLTLTLAGAILPSAELAEILRDGDVITAGGSGDVSQRKRKRGVDTGHTSRSGPASGQRQPASQPTVTSSSSSSASSSTGSSDESSDDSSSSDSSSDDNTENPGRQAASVAVAVSAKPAKPPSVKMPVTTAKSPQHLKFEDSDEGERQNQSESTTASKAPGGDPGSEGQGRGRRRKRRRRRRRGGGAFAGDVEGGALDSAVASSTATPQSQSEKRKAKNTEEGAIATTRNPETMPKLVGPPRQGDTLAYKQLVVSQSYTPVESDWMWGTVTDVNPAIRVATIELFEDSAAAPPPLGDGEAWTFGKFDMASEDGDDEEKPIAVNERTVVLELDTLLDVRLVST